MGGFAREGKDRGGLFNPSMPAYPLCASVALCGERAVPAFLLLFVYFVVSLPFSVFWARFCRKYAKNGRFRPVLPVLGPKTARFGLPVLVKFFR